jgi:hypothetical protein
MAYSPLAAAKYAAHPSNFTAGRPQGAPDHITVHHMAGILSAAQCGAVFQRPGRGGSAHYGIGNGGEIANYVDEKDTAWSDSNWNSNCKTISIETANSENGGEWPVGEAAFESLVKLVADIAKRNGLGHLVPGVNLCWHSMYAQTTCPGNHLRGRMHELAERANAINEAAPAPAPQPNKSNETIADEVIRGDWGNGEDRKARLKAAGYDYAAVQAIVNQKLAPQPAPAPAPAPEPFKVGDTVVPTRLVDYNGTPLVQYDQAYTIAELNGNRAVLTARGAVWAAMRTEDIRRA